MSLEDDLLNEDDKIKDDDDIIKIPVNLKDNDDKKDDEEIKININNELDNYQTPGQNGLDQTSQDKISLVNMGFDKLLVEKIYKTVYPVNIEEALDYLEKDKDDKYTHSYMASNLNVCSICGELRTVHAGESLLIIQERERQERERREREERERNLNTYKSKYNTFNRYSYSKKECGVCADEIPSKDLYKVRIFKRKNK